MPDRQFTDETHIWTPEEFDRHILALRRLKPDHEAQYPTRKSLTDHDRQQILDALEKGFLTYRGILHVTGMDSRTARRAVQSCVSRGLVYSIVLQRPRPAKHRNPKRPMRAYGLCAKVPSEE